MNHEMWTFLKNNFLLGVKYGSLPNYDIEETIEFSRQSLDKSVELNPDINIDDTMVAKNSDREL